MRLLTYIRKYEIKEKIRLKGMEIHQLLKDKDTELEKQI